MVRGIFLDQGLNLCLLHWQVDSLPLSHQGSPVHLFFFFSIMEDLSYVGTNSVLSFAGLSLSIALMRQEDMMPNVVG